MENSPIGAAIGTFELIGIGISRDELTGLGVENFSADRSAATAAGKDYVMPGEVDLPLDGVSSVGLSVILALVGYVQRMVGAGEDTIDFVILKLWLHRVGADAQYLCAERQCG